MFSNIYEKAEDADNIAYDTLLQKYGCPLCNEVFINAFITSCRHKFCRRCILKWLRYCRKCPECISIVTKISPVKRIDAEVERVFANLPRSFRKHRDDLKKKRFRAELEWKRMKIAQDILSPSDVDRMKEAADIRQQIKGSSKQSFFMRHQKNWSSNSTGDQQQQQRPHTTISILKDSSHQHQSEPLPLLPRVHRSNSKLKIITEIGSKFKPKSSKKSAAASKGSARVKAKDKVQFIKFPPLIANYERKESTQVALDFGSGYSHSHSLSHSNFNSASISTIGGESQSQSNHHQLLQHPPSPEEELEPPSTSFRERVILHGSESLKRIQEHNKQLEEQFTQKSTKARDSSHSDVQIAKVTLKEESEEVEFLPEEVCPHRYGFETGLKNPVVVRPHTVNVPYVNEAIVSANGTPINGAGQSQGQGHSHEYQEEPKEPQLKQQLKLPIARKPKENSNVSDKSTKSSFKKSKQTNDRGQLHLQLPHNTHKKSKVANTTNSSANPQVIYPAADEVEEFLKKFPVEKIWENDLFPTLKTHGNANANNDNAEVVEYQANSEGNTAAEKGTIDCADPPVDMNVAIAINAIVDPDDPNYRYQSRPSSARHGQSQKSGSAGQGQGQGQGQKRKSISGKDLKDRNRIVDRNNPLEVLLDNEINRYEGDTETRRLIFQTMSMAMAIEAGRKTRPSQQSNTNGVTTAKTPTTATRVLEQSQVPISSQRHALSQNSRRATTAGHDHELKHKKKIAKVIDAASKSKSTKVSKSYKNYQPMSPHEKLIAVQDDYQIQKTILAQYATADVVANQNSDPLSNLRLNKPRGSTAPPAGAGTTSHSSAYREQSSDHFPIYPSSLFGPDMNTETGGGVSVGKSNSGSSFRKDKGKEKVHKMRPHSTPYPPPPPSRSSETKEKDQDRDNSADSQRTQRRNFHRQQSKQLQRGNQKEKSRVKQNKNSKSKIQKNLPPVLDIEKISMDIKGLKGVSLPTTNALRTPSTAFSSGVSKSRYVKKPVKGQNSLDDLLAKFRELREKKKIWDLKEERQQKLRHQSQPPPHPQSQRAPQKGGSSHLSYLTPPVIVDIGGPLLEQRSQIPLNVNGANQGSSNVSYFEAHPLQPSNRPSSSGRRPNQYNQQMKQKYSSSRFSTSTAEDQQQNQQLKNKLLQNQFKILSTTEPEMAGMKLSPPPLPPKKADFEKEKENVDVGYGALPQTQYLYYHNQNPNHTINHHPPSFEDSENLAYHNHFNPSKQSRKKSKSKKSEAKKVNKASTRGNGGGGVNAFNASDGKSVYQQQQQRLQRQQQQLQNLKSTKRPKKVKQKPVERQDQHKQDFIVDLEDGLHSLQLQVTQEMQPKVLKQHENIMPDNAINQDFDSNLINGAGHGYGLPGTDYSSGGSRYQESNNYNQNNLLKNVVPNTPGGNYNNYTYENDKAHDTAASGMRQSMDISNVDVLQTSAMKLVQIQQ